MSTVRFFGILLCCLLGQLALHAEIKLGQVFGASSSSACDGEVEVIAKGSAGPFQIDLVVNGSTIVQSAQSVQGKHRFTGVCAGEHTIWVTNATGCQKILSATVPNCRLDDWDIIGTVTRSCEPLNNGMVSVAVGGTGVTPPLQYYWSHGVVGTPLVSNLAPGDYGVVVIDARGCRDSKVFEVPSSNMSIDHHFVFNGPNQVSIKVTPNATHSPINYIWSNGATTQNLDNVIPAWYRVTATNSLGCQAIGVFNPAACVNRNLKISIDRAALTMTRIPLQVTGGNPPYQFSWVGPGSFTANVQSPTVSLTGDYCVTVTDACQQGAVLCQRISCEAGNAQVSTENRCLETNVLAGWFGNGWIRVNEDVFNAPNCGSELFVNFEGQGWEPVDGEWSKKIQGGGLFCLEIKNGCGCIIKRPCFYFSSNNADVVGYQSQSLGNLAPGLYDDNLQVITQCFACEMCVDNLNIVPDPLETQHCRPGTVEFRPMTYVPSQQPNTRPCEGGQVVCGGVTLQMPDGIFGMEIINWNAPPIQLSSGACQYPSGCLFFGNTFTTPPLPPFQGQNPPGNRFIYVSNPLGHVVPAGNCPTTGTGICPDNDVIFDPADPPHPTDPCLHHRICRSTGADAGWIGFGDICKCRSQGTCMVLRVCLNVGYVSCQSNAEQTLLSTNCDLYEDINGPLDWCSGHHQAPPPGRQNGTAAEQGPAMEHSTPLRVKAWPNPFDEQVDFIVQSDQPQDISLQIYNQYGQLMQRWAPQAMRGTLKVEINTKNFTNGVYYFSIVSNSGQRIGLPLIKVGK